MNNITELKKQYPDYIYPFGDEFTRARKELGDETYDKHYTTVFGKPVLNFARKIVFNLPQDCRCNCKNCLDYELRQSPSLSNAAYLQQALKVLQEFPSMDSITITGGTLPSKDFNQLINYIKQYSPTACIIWNTNGVNINADYNVEDIKYVNLHRQAIDEEANKKLLRTNSDVITLKDAKQLFKDKLTIRAVVNKKFNLEEYVMLGLPLFLNRQLPPTRETDKLLNKVYDKLEVHNNISYRRNEYVKGFIRSMPVMLGLGDDFVTHLSKRYPTYLNVVILHRSGYVTGSWFEDDKLLLTPPQYST